MAGNANPGALAGAAGAENAFHENAAGPQKIAHQATKGTPYRVTPVWGEPFTLTVTGRLHWALEEMRKAGSKGVTRIDNPAPRWSAYIHKSCGPGVSIKTLHESHGGDFPGNHARYVLRARVMLDGEGAT